jgi:sterol 3beta-glucosyltransferase
VSPFSHLSIAMRWPRISQHRTKSPEHHDQRSSSPSSDTPHDDQPAQLAQFSDPGLARLFSDADLYGRILTSRPDIHEDELVLEDSQPAHDSLNGFSQLIARDLDDNERAASEKFAQLSVSNWTSTLANNLAPEVDPDESDESASDDGHDATSPGNDIKEAVEPNIDDQFKLTPDEVLDLLQQEFGTLAPPGEEKLLVETDATLFQDVVILV